MNPLYLCFSQTCNKDNNSFALRNEREAQNCYKEHKTLVFNYAEVCNQIKGDDQTFLNQFQQPFQTFLIINEHFKESFRIFNMLSNLNQDENNIQKLSEWIQNHIKIIDKKKTCKVQFEASNFIDQTISEIQKFRSHLYQLEEQIKNLKTDRFACVKLKQSNSGNNSQQSQVLSNSNQNQQSSNQQTSCHQQSSQPNQFNPQVQESQRNHPELITQNQQQQQLQQQQHFLQNQQAQLKNYSETNNQINTLQRLNLSNVFENQNSQQQQSILQEQSLINQQAINRKKPKARSIKQINKVEELNANLECQDQINKKIKINSQEKGYIVENQNNQIQQQFPQNQQQRFCQSTPFEFDDRSNISTGAITPFLQQQNNYTAIKQQHKEGKQDFQKLLDFQDSNESQIIQVLKKQQKQKSEPKKTKKQPKLVPGQRKISQFYIITKREKQEEGLNDYEQVNEQKQIASEENNEQKIQTECNIVIGSTDMVVLDGDDEEEEIHRRNNMQKIENLKNYILQTNKSNHQKIIGFLDNQFYTKANAQILRYQIDNYNKNVFEFNVKVNCSCIVENKQTIFSISLNSNSEKLYLLKKTVNSNLKNTQLHIEDIKNIQSMSCCYNKQSDCLFLSVLYQNQVACYEISFDTLKILKEVKSEIKNNTFECSKLNYKITCETLESQDNYLVIVYDFYRLLPITIKKQSESLIANPNNNHILTIEEGISFLKFLKINNQTQVFLGTSQHSLNLLSTDRFQIFSKIKDTDKGFCTDCFALNDDKLALVVQSGIIFYSIKDKSKVSFSEVKQIHSAIKLNENILVSLEKQQQPYHQEYFAKYIYQNGVLNLLK